VGALSDRQSTIGGTGVFDSSSTHSVEQPATVGKEERLPSTAHDGSHGIVSEKHRPDWKPESGAPFGGEKSGE
jgi:hypothetical protein